MKNLFQILFFIVLTFHTFIACEKEKDETEDNSNNQVIDTAQIQTISVIFDTPLVLDSVFSDTEGDGIYESTVNEYINECMKDDVLTFKQDGTLNSDDNGTVCEENLVYLSGTYTYDEKTKKLIIYSPEETYNLTARKLNESIFEFSMNDEGLNLLFRLIKKTK